MFSNSCKTITPPRSIWLPGGVLLCVTKGRRVVTLGNLSETPFFDVFECECLFRVTNNSYTFRSHQKQPGFRPNHGTWFRRIFWPE